MQRFLLILLLAISPASVLSQESVGEQKKVIVIRRWANIRSRPTTSSTVLRRAYEGEEFDWIEEREGWVKVQMDEISSAWIFGELVEVVEASGVEVADEDPFPIWVYVPVFLAIGVAAAALVYYVLARQQKILDYAGRLDRMTSAGYIDNVSRDDVVRLTRAFGIGDRTARSVAGQTYLDRYRVSSSHRRLTEKEKASFRKLQLVLQLGDAEVMRLMAKVYKGKNKEERRSA